jgi:hypothetical protein
LGNDLGNSAHSWDALEDDHAKIAAGELAVVG